MIEATIPVGNADELVMLLGASDQHLRRIRESVPAKISARDGKIHVYRNEGDGVRAAGSWLEAEGNVAHIPGVW